MVLNKNRILKSIWTLKVCIWMGCVGGVFFLRHSDDRGEEESPNKHDRALFCCRSRMMPGSSLSRASFGMTVWLAGEVTTSNHTRHSDDAGGGIPSYNRPYYLLLWRQADAREIPRRSPKAFGFASLGMTWVAR